MKPEHGCGMEDAVRKAAAGEQWTAALREHAAGCRDCADAALVSQWLREDLQAREDPILPDATLLWWKAQAARRREAADRAVVPIEIAEKAGAATAAITFAGCLVWILPHLGPVFAALCGLSVVIFCLGLYVVCQRLPEKLVRGTRIPPENGYNRSSGRPSATRMA